MNDRMDTQGVAQEVAFKCGLNTDPAGIKRLDMKQR